ncbi:MAG: UDP-N-acetylmuramoyl-L-alanine--D-glutamate ligase, partial [Calditrichaeota bacterium]|nr:UDP-N-acetylmuramoyl-L-alanine--D-glutamate ligase [Calditrichota bacterium]
MNGKLIHVLGMGKSGAAAARLLLDVGWSVIISDTQPEESLRNAVDIMTNAGAIVVTGGHEEALKHNADLAVISPGIKLDAPVVCELRERGVKIISELEIGWIYCCGKIAAITGSNGKTTTTALIGKIFDVVQLDSFTCGNIGLPLSAVAELTNERSLLALEVSSFQLMTIDTFKPAVAVLLNLTPDHLDWHGGFDEYAKAKSRLWLNQDDNDWLVYNVDDNEVWKLISTAGSRLFPFSTKHELKEGAFLYDDEMVFRLPDADELRIPRSELNLLGRHNTENGLAAISASLLLGVNQDDVKSGVNDFSPVPHRLETIAELDGITWINDSKATNVEAGMAALEAMDRPVVMIAGGVAKGGDFTKFRNSNLKLI